VKEKVIKFIVMPLSCLIILGIFFFSYRAYKSNIGKEKNAPKTDNTAVTTMAEEEKILSDTVLKFYLEDNAGKRTYQLEFSNAIFSGMTSKELENYYKDGKYKVEKINSKEVVLVRKDSAIPSDMYVLGIKDGKVNIYRTDKTGALTDITNKDSEALDEGRLTVDVRVILSKPGDFGYLNDILNNRKTYKDINQAVESLVDFN